MDNHSVQSVMDHLTQREMEILRLVADGLTNQNIAEQLFLTLGTVKWYLKQIYGKLHVGSRTQAIAAARMAGLLDASTVGLNLSTSLVNLPQQPTPFVGREADLAEISRWLRDASVRLVTIVGLGGMGKTRLALETASAHINDFRDGVFFSPLATLPSSNLMATAIAESVKFSFAPGQSTKIQLFSYLSDKQMLLVLDNMEHLLADVSLVAELLQIAPRIKILVTSRERLQLQNEKVFKLEGFDSSSWKTPEEAIESSAAKLFLQSAQRVKTSFELTSSTLDDLSRICRLLGGMPLGILLAASWIDVLSISEIAKEIEGSFAFLEGNWRDLPIRQRSLRAVFEHSWNLLTDDERSTMRGVSLFRGGFTREAAEQVANSSLKTLANLVNKSLLSRDLSGRFDMHELLRQYSEKKLDELPQEREEIQGQYAAFYAAFMDTLWIGLRSEKVNAATEAIAMEFDNVRAAWKIMVEQERFQLIIMTTRSLWAFLNRRALFDEGIEIFKSAIDALRNDQGDQARELAVCELLVGLSNCYEFNGLLNEAQLTAEECLTHLQNQNAPELVVRAYIPLCLTENALGEHQTMKIHAQQAITAAQAIEDTWYRAIGILFYGWSAFGAGEYEAALDRATEALSFFEKAGDVYFQGLCLTAVLGPTAFEMKNYEVAKEYYLKGIAFLDSIGNLFELSLSHLLLFSAYVQLGEYDAANSVFRLSLSYIWKTGLVPWLLKTLLAGSKVFEIRGKYNWAVMTLSLVVNHGRAFQGDIQIALAQLEGFRSLFSPEDFSVAYERGKALDLGSVVVQLLQDT